MAHHHGFDGRLSQQRRALRLVATSGGGVPIETWLVDHAGRPNDENDLAGIARDLAFLDPQGGPRGRPGPERPQRPPSYSAAHAEPAPAAPAAGGSLLAATFLVLSGRRAQVELAPCR